VLVIDPRRGPLQLRDEVAEIVHQYRPRDRREEQAVGLGHAVAAEQEDAARLPIPSAPRRLLHQPRQQRLHLVEIIRRMLVQDDDVGAQALEPPVLLRVEHLPHQRERR
jgi:hypothetical protein